MSMFFRIIIFIETRLKMLFRSQRDYIKLYAISFQKFKRVFAPNEFQK